MCEVPLQGGAVWFECIFGRGGPGALLRLTLLPLHFTP